MSTTTSKGIGNTTEAGGKVYQTVAEIIAERDALKASNAALVKQVELMQAVVNAASILEQSIQSDDQDGEEHYDAQTQLCEVVGKYRAVLASVKL